MFKTSLFVTKFIINKELNTTKTIDTNIHKKYIFVYFKPKVVEQLGQICFPKRLLKYLFIVSSTFSLQFGQFINLPCFFDFIIDIVTFL
ncbi:MAG: hypothetical protein PHY66_04750 [Aliarcobacter sp.]|nr:hypothetical protein [Aliarcobacter sp.]